MRQWNRHSSLLVMISPQQRLLRAVSSKKLQQAICSVIKTANGLLSRQKQKRLKNEYSI
nr:MAG TPA: hypothetical protein [Bacteriophage sp.]